MREIEVLSSIEESKFKSLIESFKTKYEYKFQKRLGFILASYQKSNPIDTRIKITNWKIHVVQKVGEVTSKYRNSEEMNLDVNLSPEKLLDLYKILKNLGKSVVGFTTPIQQYENHLFETEYAEVKFYKQFNSINSFYGFEVELKDHSMNLNHVVMNLGLVIDNVERTPEYWYDYDKKYNIDSESISYEEILNLIRKYL
ncbi:MAG: hypothetical protein Q9M91_08975 [Candidatus Dojkabacteria bacterium]|nr:hypothetical protein [Candidatus Dojkabacteria bacterium]MDQ7021905.1 hypothetical protein [Candidatus Dojkabacteria bacterium]